MLWDQLPHARPVEGLLLADYVLYTLILSLRPAYGAKDVTFVYPPRNINFARNNQPLVLV